MSLISRARAFSLSDSVVEQVAHALAVVGTTDSLGQDGSHVDELEPTAFLAVLDAQGFDLVLGDGDGVCDDEPRQRRSPQDLDGLAGQDAVGDQGDDVAGAVSDQRVGGLGQRAAGVGHVVDQDGDFAFDRADEGHAADFVGS